MRNSLVWEHGIGAIEIELERLISIPLFDITKMSIQLFGITKMYGIGIEL